MSLLLLVGISLVCSTVGQVQVPCYGEGCVNVTVYLGPRWGTKVIMVPRTQNMTRSGDERHNRTQHRPVPQGGEIQVDFMDDESSLKITQNLTTRNPLRSNIRWPWWTPSTKTTTTTTGKPESRSIFPINYPVTKVRVVTDKFGMGTVDLSFRGYNGVDVKHALTLTLEEHDRKQITKLILDGNDIQYLPVLVFPVELEYDLQELSLNDNPIYYLSSFTRFELSRLSRLKTLNMSRCNLRSIEMPYLPSLEVLDLSHNQLTYLPPSLGRLDNLLQLYLRNNRLSYLTDSPLSSLNNLLVLDLGDNVLQEIWDQPLEHLSTLVTLKLDNNLLTTLPRLGYRRTVIVYFANNTLKCSCDLMQWLGAQDVQLSDEYSERCQDNTEMISLHELRVNPEEHRHLCANKWESHSWAALTLWYQRNPDIMRIIYRVVGAMLLVVVLVILLRRRKRLIGKVKSKGIAYDILDDQQVSTVSGPLGKV